MDVIRFGANEQTDKLKADLIKVLEEHDELVPRSVILSVLSSVVGRYIAIVPAHTYEEAELLAHLNIREGYKTVTESLEKLSKPQGSA